MSEDHPWDGPGEWPIEDEGRLLETPYLTAGYDDVRTPDGASARYYWAQTADAVAVVAHDRSSDELVLVEQYRPQLRARLLEVPAGRIDDGEPPREAARRELREETGYQADRLERLGAYHPTGRTRMTRHVWYATELTAGDPDRDDTEYLTVRRRDPADVLAAASERPLAGWTLTPLLWARNAALL